MLSVLNAIRAAGAETLEAMSCALNQGASDLREAALVRVFGGDALGTRTAMRNLYA
jgi:hypothetical protein